MTSHSSLFNAWHKTAYMRYNPMALYGAGVAHTVIALRGVRPERVDLVVDRLPSAPTINFTQRQSAVRDIFIFTALRGLGLNAVELVQSRMSAFYP